MPHESRLVKQNTHTRQVLWELQWAVASLGASGRVQGPCWLALWLQHLVQDTNAPLDGMSLRIPQIMSLPTAEIQRPAMGLHLADSGFWADFWLVEFMLPLVTNMMACSNSLDIHYLLRDHKRHHMG
jgi:hypothetical protein